MIAHPGLHPFLSRENTFRGYHDGFVLVFLLWCYSVESQLFLLLVFVGGDFCQVVTNCEDCIL